MDFQSQKSYEKLRRMALQPYHQILCMLKHIQGVNGQNNHMTPSTFIEFDGFESKVVDENFSFPGGGGGGVFKHQFKKRSKVSIHL